MKRMELFSKWKQKLFGYFCMLTFMLMYTVGCTSDYSDSETEFAENEQISIGINSESVGLSDELDAELFSEKADEDTAVSHKYSFRNEDLLTSHYEKHGKDMGFSSPEEYESAANKVLEHEGVLHKQEKEDGDDVYYLEKTNEFVVISTDGYIRTYFFPDDGIDYFNRQ